MCDKTAIKHCSAAEMPWPTYSILFSSCKKTDSEMSHHHNFNVFFSENENCDAKIITPTDCESLQSQYMLK